MAVLLTDTVHWLNECFTHEDGVHEHVAVYLVRAGDEHILVDSGSFHHREALASQIDAVTDGAGLDAIVLSHSDYPHSANVRPFRERWGDVDLVASSGAPAYQGLQDAISCTIGGSMAIRGREFSFIDPPLADRSHTTWIYDHGDGVLFTADGFGNVHEPGECDATSADLDGGVAYDDIRRFNAETLVWLRYVDPEKLRAALTGILEDYDVEWVAPIHGNPVAGDDREVYLDRLVAAAGDIADEYRERVAGD